MKKVIKKPLWSTYHIDTQVFDHKCILFNRNREIKSAHLI